MVAETEHDIRPVEPADRKDARGWIRQIRRFRDRYRFSSLTRRIVFLNVAALVLLVSGVLYLNQFRAGLIDSRVRSLLTQGEIIAGAIAASATIDTDAITIDPERLLGLKQGETASPADQGIKTLEFPINPERAAPILRRLISPTKTRAKIYDTEGSLIVDSRSLYLRDQILSFDLPPLETERKSTFAELWQSYVGWLFASDLPVYKELGPEQGKDYPEVVAALAGASVSIVRVNEQQKMIVSVAVPVQRFRAVLGALVLSTKGGDIDSTLRAERWAILRMFLVALGVTILLSFLLAGTIAGPVRRLADAADRVRKGIAARVEIPDFTHRRDEIGELSGSLRDMTTALYNRIDAIENFAADVAHELKNPLTSLRSAVETLPLAKTKAARQRLVEIVQDDVRRLDRLISDISDASRLDAELAREEFSIVEIVDILETVVMVTNETRKDGMPEVHLEIDTDERDGSRLRVSGHASRLGQVVRNLLDNAISFSPPNGRITVAVRRVGREIEITVEDEGPGIRPESLGRIFDRFHTDRPGDDEFGKNSGLGLSISKQVIDAHRGRIWAENRIGVSEPDPESDPDSAGPPASRVLGARFVVRLPAFRKKKKDR